MRTRGKWLVWTKDEQWGGGGRADSLSLQSLKTMTLKNYQASERGVCGGRQNVYCLKALRGTREVGRKEGDREKG